MKRILSILFVLAMLVSLFPTALAEENIGELKQKIEELESQIAEKDAKISELTDIIIKLNSQLMGNDRNNSEPSAIEQLNEYEKWFFDVLVDLVLPSFYHSSAARVKQLGPSLSENYENNMMLEVRIQGENRLGGTIFKDFLVLCEKDAKESTYLPCFTDDGLFKSPHQWKENTKIDISKINLALEEYWENKGMA